MIIKMWESRSSKPSMLLNLNLEMKLLSDKKDVIRLSKDILEWLIKGYKGWKLIQIQSITKDEEKNG